jgi:hypothetical protein
LRTFKEDQLQVHVPMTPHQIRQSVTITSAGLGISSLLSAALHSFEMDRNEKVQSSNSRKPVVILRKHAREIFKQKIDQEYDSDFNQLCAFSTVS